MSTDNLEYTGQCQCGGIQYVLAGEPLEVYFCHCRECQKQSSSAFGISVIARAADFRVVSGQPKSWSRGTDQGNRLDCYFCPDCGSRLWHQADNDLGHVSIKGGSLDVMPDMRDAAHIWTSRKIAGIEIPKAARQFPTEPDD